MNGKKSFIMYVDQRDTFDALPDDKAGQLIKHIFSYVCDENPETDDILINAVFAGIRNTLKRDLATWRSKKEILSDSGVMGNLKRRHKDLYKGVKKGEIKLDEALVEVDNRKSSPPDKKVSPPIANVAVSVSDSDSVSEKNNNTTNVTQLEQFVSKRNTIDLGNVKPLQKVRKINEEMKKQRKRLLKEYTIEEIKIAVNSYCKEIKARKKDKDNDRYYNHRFTLYQFLKQSNGLAKFINYQT